MLYQLLKAVFHWQDTARMDLRCQSRSEDLRSRSIFILIFATSPCSNVAGTYARERGDGMFIVLHRQRSGRR